MLTVVIILVSIITVAFLFATIWGKSAHEEPDDTIIWRKLDEHEKKLTE